MQNEIKWFRGEPKSPGWYYTGTPSYHRSRQCWRWWSGKYWSAPAYEHYTPGEAYIAAMKRSNAKDEVLYCFRWPHGQHPSFPVVVIPNKWECGTPRSRGNAFTAHIER